MFLDKVNEKVENKTPLLFNCYRVRKKNKPCAN
jgi:hypothetical protein